MTNWQTIRNLMHSPARNSALLAAGYSAFGLLGLLGSSASTDPATKLLSLAFTGIGALLAIEAMHRGMREQRLQARLDDLTEQNTLLQEDVSRWHRRAVKPDAGATISGIRAENDKPFLHVPDMNVPDLHFVAANSPAAPVATAGETPDIVPFTPRSAAPAGGKFDETVIRSLLAEALRTETLDIVVQPIMRLPQRRPAMLEILARLPGGKGKQPVTAARFMPHLKEAKKVPVMDRLALQYCFDLLTDQTRRQHNLPYVLNISAETFRDSAYMSKLLQYLRRNGDLAGRLIFEMRQTDYKYATDNVQSIIKALARIGCRFSMDHVDNPQFTRSYLQEHNISFVKLSGTRLAQMARSITGVETVQRIKDNLARHGVALIAEGVEEESTLMDILDLSLDYGQGYLFGQPVAPIIPTRTPRRVA